MGHLDCPPSCVVSFFTESSRTTLLLDSWLDAATGAEGLLNARADGLALTAVAVARRSAGKRRNIVARVKRKRTVYALVC